MSECQSVFLHVDLDAFFASVEQHDHPEWKGKAVIVGGKPGDRRAVVSTASYEARACGVHSAMPLSEAVRRCPQGIFVRGNMKRYHEVSELVMNIFRNYSPDVQQMSVDEAFIDLTGTQRLFGAPEETARRIKAEVKAATGLTVSVGMASTRYLAKIASGLQKPDGLCIVEPGKEEDFMLSLPMEKIWGAGAKTQKKLREAGMSRVRDIYEKSLPLLQSLFGKAGGSFLYTAVRGGEAESFNQEAKTHSLSSENTYAFDLQDRDTIDTALLQLSYTVSFRLLREHLRSSAVGVKIRYDDFTTVSIQDTSSREITSIEDLFDRVKALFYKKYEPGRGIRLLGVAALHVESLESPRQAELFDFGEDKKRRVEEAVLRAKQKNPGLQITKARLLKALPLLFFLPALFCKAAPLPAQSEAQPLQTERGAGAIIFDSSALPLDDEGGEPLFFSGKAGSRPFDFSLQGYWQSLFSGSASYSFGFGSLPAFSASPIQLSQKVDLNLHFLLSGHWFFDAAFADDFERNTVAAGYTRGTGLVKEARIANRGIVFPDFYAVDRMQRGIGGSESESEAPGFSLALKGKKWQAHGLVRYDRLQAKEKSWYGKNSLSSASIDLASWIRGGRFLLPSPEAVTAISAVYVENSSGSYRDQDGRRYSRLDESQYLLSAAAESLFLARSAGAMEKSGRIKAVAVSFSDALPDTAALLQDVKDLFSHQGAYADGESGLDITAYLAPEKGSIDGKAVLYLQHPGGFSPFSWANRYEAGLSGDSSQALIIHRETKAASSAFLAAAADDSIFSTSDFFDSSPSQVEVYADAGSDGGGTGAESRFPLAKIDPGIYLSFAQKTDLILSIRSYSAVSRFDIGTKAVAGTLRVYKNGLLDSGARYDEESGCISLSSAVSASDHIYACWYEDADDAESGALAAAAGIQWTLSDRLQADVSASARWTMLQDDFATSEKSAPGFATLAGGFTWQGSHLTLSNTLAATIESANTRGRYCILSAPEEDADWLSLQKDGAFSLPEGFTPSLQGRPGEAAGSAGTEPVLLAEKNGSQEAGMGSLDSSLPCGYALPVDWDFSVLPLTAGDASEEEPYWASISIYLSEDAASIASASRFTIYLKKAAGSGNCKVYLQMGVEADDDFDYENSSLIPTWQISADSLTEAADDVYRPFLSDSDQWQEVTISICDEDRSRILQGNGLRLIVSSTEALKGRLYAGSYRLEERVFSLTASDRLSLTAGTDSDSLLNLRWQEETAGESSDDAAGENSIQISRYFSEVDLQGYTKLTLPLVWGKEQPLSESDMQVTISLDRPQEDESFATCLSVSLSYADISQGSQEKLTVDLTEKSASLGNKRLESPRVDTSIIPTRLCIYIENSSAGSLSLGALTLSGLKPTLLFESDTAAQWKQDGTLVSSREGKPLVKDLLFSARGSSQRILPGGNQAAESTFTSEGSAQASILGLKVSGDVGHQQAASQLLSRGSHRIESDGALFSLLSVSESYRYDAEEKALAKANALTLDFSSLSLPLRLSAQTKARMESRLQSQAAEMDFSWSPGSLSLQGQAKFNQEVQAGSGDSQGFSASSYGSGWLESSSLAFSGGKEDASRRGFYFSGSGDYHFSFLACSPGIKMESRGSYRKGSSILFTDSESCTLSLPFQVKRQRFSLSWTKKTGGSQGRQAGGSYQADTSFFYRQLQEKDWFYKALPLADLLSTDLASSIQKDATASTRAIKGLYYEGSYSASWKRPVFGGARDIIFPRYLSASFTRSVHAASSISDYYQLKSSVGYTALNIFGSQGSLPLAHWFRQDEYAAQGSATLKIPRRQASRISMLYTLYLQASFFVKSGSSFKTGLEARFESPRDWSGKATCIWKRPGSFSPLAALPGLFTKKAAGKPRKLIRTDSFQLAASSLQSSSSKDALLTYSGKINHQLDLLLTDSVTINSALALGYEAEHEKVMTIMASASIGATIQF